MKKETLRQTYEAIIEMMEEVATLKEVARKARNKEQALEEQMKRLEHSGLDDEALDEVDKAWSKANEEWLDAEAKLERAQYIEECLRSAANLMEDCVEEEMGIEG